jgi:hypothetical protein
VYYLYRYWLCVRQAVGTPVAQPPTDEERKDFETLVVALAGAYKPYLTDQLATVEFPAGLPAEVLSGKLDCFEGQEETAAVFERLLTVESAMALLGRKAFEAHAREQFFWFCRCWCLCAIRFGCCLARARSLIEVLRCLVFYRRCVRRCFQPLTCELIAPRQCVEEGPITSAGIAFGIEIRGTATGAFCSHYILEWREAGTAVWRTGPEVHYPGGGAQGPCGVVNSTLGYLQTFPLVPAGPVEIRICVYSMQQAVAPRCCTITFELQRNLVYIRGIEGIDAATPPGFLDVTAQLTDGAGLVRSFGTALKIFGSAWVGGCHGFDIKRYTLSFHRGFVVDPTLATFVQFWQVDYNTPLQIDADLNKIFERELTSRWRELKWCFPLPCVTIANFLENVRWSTQVPQSYAVEPPGPPFWVSTPLPLINCQSGRYTLRLTTEDTGGNIRHDLQWAWFDNKEIYGKITQIAGVPPCATVNLSQFAVAGGDCSVPWPANLLGIAYDEYIEEGNAAPPSDNFDAYQLWIKKDGGGWFSLPIPGPIGPGVLGTSRVGDPGVRCANADPPPGMVPPESPGILAVLDLRRLDAACNPAEPGLTLRRGECCGYIIWLQVRDKTICPSLYANRHQKDEFFPFCVCNDLRPTLTHAT